MNNRSIARFLIGALAGAASVGALSAQWEALPEVAPSPADNPTTAAKVELGKMLYFDPRFSATGTVSCDSCHNVMEGGDDHRSTSMGVHGEVGGRNAPTVYNAAFHSTQFWDGRAASLEDQAKGPVVNPLEMGMKDLDSAVGRLRAIPGYRDYFVRAFGEAVRVMAKSQLNKDLSDAQAADLVAFLGALDGPFPIQTMPRLPATPGDLLP